MADLLHDDGCRHRGMDGAVVAVGSWFAKGKAKAVARSKRTRIEGSLICGDRMRHAIVICPGHFGSHVDREALRTERKVRQRDAIPTTTRRRRRGCGGRCRRCRGTASTGVGRCGSAPTRRHRHTKTDDDETQPGFGDNGFQRRLHGSFSSPQLLFQRWERVLISRKEYAAWLRDHPCASPLVSASRERATPRFLQERCR